MKMKATDSQVSANPARRQFFAIALYVVALNVVFQFFLGTLRADSLHPLLRGLLETIAVAVFAIPPAYYFYMRPLRLWLTERQDAVKTLRKSEMHYRIASEITTTFAFDLSVAKDGSVSLDWVSGSFYTFAGRREEVRTFESLVSHIHPDDKDRVVLDLRRLISRPQAAEIECRAYVRDELRWVALYAKPEWDEEQGRITAIYGAVKDITERKKVEEALLDSQRQIEFILGATKTGLDIIDEHFRIHYVDPQWSKVYGSWQGKRCYEYFEGRSEPCPPCSFQKALATREVSVTEWNLAREGNRPVQIKAIPYQDKDGTWLVAEVNVDISERKLAEEALKQSENRFKRMFQYSASGMVIVSADFRFLQANDAFCKMLGYTESELQGKTFQDVTYPDDRAQGGELAGRVLAGDMDMFHFEKRYVRKDGAVVWGLVSSTLLRDSQNNPLHFVTQIEDITERKRAEEAVRASEEKFRSIIEQSADGIAVADQSGAIVEWNRAQEALTGLKRTDVVGRPLREIQSRFIPKDAKTGELLARVAPHPEAHLPGGREWGGEKREYQIGLPDGSSKSVMESTFLVRQGATDMSVSILSDMTERQKAENDRKIVEHYLQQSQKMESIGVLAGGIAHDFNNLLAIVYGYVDLAASEANNGVVSEYLRQAMEGIDRAKGLTHQLLTFAKGGTPVKRKVSLVSLIRETSQFALSGSSAKCAFHIQPDLWSCNVDRNQIGQVIQNIMINAIQAMPMGGTIDVSAANATLSDGAHPMLRGGNYALISIRDQGTGIPGEMLPRIFDPFFTTKTKGHGLGLAISYSIVLRHDGALNVESELGKGSVFHIYLPACGERVDDGAAPPVAEHNGTGRVLVMDDEEAIRTLLSRILESFGYEVVCKENGEDALDCFRKEAAGGNPFSAVILDLTVPGGMGGREVCEKLRKLSPEVPVFVASGYSNDPVMAQPRDYGFTASLGKPFRKSEVVEMFEKHMGKG